MQLYLDHFGDSPFQQHLYIVNSPVEINGLKFGFHSAAEGEKLAGELTPSFCSTADLEEFLVS